MHYCKTKNREIEEKDKWKANFTVEISPLAYMGTSLISLTSFNNINGFFNLERFYIIAICISILDINQSISSCTVYFTKSFSCFWCFKPFFTNICLFFSVKITVFYIIYYALLAAFFIAMLLIFFQTLKNPDDDEAGPTWQNSNGIIGGNPGKIMLKK